ncbi:DUF3048 domain-containing protein [Streptomyces chiangmaiensis]|uniref:DUF3048 domain-containing protein n=1 Tax=Streptomyces chiangmaiensis TaxID=766497 RepID=A0ABU7FQQ8_9ACTN|nr:DUF3048 domain-containing protein [Streptomyces chiangmaiensis]MED7826422.1 DUF3048 domain-containing protein [Streptomyces chiangmaiensis]
MRQIARMRRGAATAALLTVALTGSLLAGCSSGGGRADARGEQPGRHPQDGDRTSAAPAGPLLAVKIDNVPAARPQTGLDQADIVYAEQVEGGLSRLMAVFATKLPSVVGPVRSARESDLEVLRQFHDPTLAFSGAQHKLLPLIDKAPLTPEPPDKNSGAYFRAGGKVAPHNLYLRPQRLLRSAPGAAALTTGFRFGAAPSGGTPETTRTVRFPSARFTFTWSARQHSWLVAMDGTPTVTPDGARVAPATVVVQYVRVRASHFHDVLGNNSPYSETVGSGRAQVLRDGRVFDAHWQRPSATDGTRFTTTDGAPMNFAKGQVWVVLAKA